MDLDDEDSSGGGDPRSQAPCRPHPQHPYHTMEQHPLHLRPCRRRPPGARLPCRRTNPQLLPRPLAGLRPFPRPRFHPCRHRYQRTPHFHPLRTPRRHILRRRTRTTPPYLHCLPHRGLRRPCLPRLDRPPPLTPPPCPVHRRPSAAPSQSRYQHPEAPPFPGPHPNSPTPTTTPCPRTCSQRGTASCSRLQPRLLLPLPQTPSQGRLLQLLAKTHARSCPPAFLTPMAVARARKLPRSRYPRPP